MYYEKNKSNNKKRRLRIKKTALPLLLTFLLIAISITGITLAYLATQTSEIKNIFNPSAVTCQVEETFDGTTKTNVNVKNTGDTEAYIRVKLVTYRVNAAGQQIGGTAEIPDFTPGAGWVLYTDGFYYYTLPVAPNGKPANPLISSITLVGSYSDADGGKQAIDVIAEAIQSAPAEAAGEAWGVSISEGVVSNYQ